MNMKNLNPSSGLKQITKGYICVQRRHILELVKGGILKPNELGFYLILVLSTDWDSDKYRKGYIRHELLQLSKIWNISYSTFTDNINILVEKGLVTKERINQQTVHSIPNFDAFTQKVASATAKEFLSNKCLKDLFPNLLSNYEISENTQANESDSFRGSYKNGLSDEDKNWINKHY